MTFHILLFFSGLLINFRCLLFCLFMCLFTYRFIMNRTDKHIHPHVSLLMIICISGMLPLTEALSYWTARLNNQAAQRKSFLVKDLYDFLQHKDHNINLSMSDFILGIRNYTREQTLDWIKTASTNEAVLHERDKFNEKNRYCWKIEFDWEQSLTLYTYIILLQRDNTYLTSGFSGSLQIRILRSYVDYFLISIHSHKRRHIFSTSCFHTKHVYLPMSIVASASIKEGKICFDRFRTIYLFLKLAVYDFDFKDPRSLNNLYECLYGGLFIHQPSSQKTISVCENIVNTIIYGDMHTFIMLLVWYPGYSYGSILARFLEDRCITKHLQWGDHLENNQIRFDDKLHIYCHRVICPTHFNKYENGRKKQCKIYLKTVNQTFNMVGIVQTLIPCRDNHSTFQATYNMSILYSANWPITRNKLINLSANYISFIHFDFLRKLNFSIPFLCDTARPSLQVGVILQISTCYIVRPNKKNIRCLSAT